MVVKSLRDRIRHRFNVSIAETDRQDTPGAAVLTVAVVSADRGLADAMLDRVDRFLEEDGRAILRGVRRELF